LGQSDIRRINAEGETNQKAFSQSEHARRGVTRAGSSLDLAIYADKEKIGTMIIGQGSLSWKGGKRQITKRIPWSRFAAMMDMLAYGGA